MIIPPNRYAEALQVSEQLGEALVNRFPLAEGVKPVNKNPFYAYVNNTWKSTLSTVGADGFPPIATAGNVLRTETAVKLSIRLPPTKNVEEAKAAFLKLMTENVPYGAEVTVSNVVGMPGWNCPEISPYL